MLKNAVAMWRCFDLGRYARKKLTVRMLAQKKTAYPAARTSDESTPRMTPASALAGECPRRVGIAVARDPERFGEQLGQDDGADQQQDRQSVARQRQPTRTQDQSARECPPHGEQHAQHQQVLDGQGDPPQPAVQRPGDHPVDQPERDAIRRADREDDEAPEDRGMQEDPRPARGTCLTCRIANRISASKRRSG